MKTIDLSVVILNYNTIELTRTCLATVFASKLGKYTMEVLVCDNGSADGSVEMIKREFPKAQLIENKKNLGFAAGNNPGIKQSRGRYVLLLNTDTEVPKETFATMLAFMDDHLDVGASTCKVLLPNGSIDPACHRGFPTPWASITYMLKLEKLFPKSKLFGQYHQGYKDLSTIHEVDCIVGAFFLIRKSVIARIGPMDEDYFMYGEDIDWAYKIRKEGWPIVYNPTCTILHKKKQSGRANPLQKRRVTTEIYFHTYNWLFYKKHYAQKYGVVLNVIVNVFYATRIFMLKRVGI